MGSYNTAVITTVGQALLTSVLGAQGTMTFTKLQTSSYSYASGADLSALTSLNNVEQEVNIGSATIVDSTHIAADATISNSGISTEYNVNTLGIFASDGVNEVLFAVSTAVTPDVIPVDSGGTPSTYKYKFTLAVSSTSDITISAVGDIAANDVSFDNTTSGLPATDVQTAIDTIDAEVDDITKRLSGQSNRNLLDNPFFTINQRGQSSYSTAGKYTVDRWKLLASDNAAPDIYVNGVTLVKCGWFVQIDPDCVVSAEPKTFTMSAIIDNVLYKRTFTSIADGLDHPHSFSPIDNMIIVFTEHSSNSDGYDSLSFGFGNCTTAHTIKAAKVEEGSVSTLAYDVAPNYAEELLKCQRFDKCITATVDNGIIGMGVCSVYDPNALQISIPHHLRARPTVTYSSLSDILCIVESGSNHYATSVVIKSFNSDMLSISIGVNKTLTEGKSYPVYLMKSNDHVARLEFSAEL